MKVFQKGASRVYKRSSKGVSKELKAGSKAFYGSFKGVQSKCQLHSKTFSKKVSKVFQGCFDEVLVVQFTRCMNLIAATRAEGGLVLFRLWASWYSKRPA